MAWLASLSRPSGSDLTAVDGDHRTRHEGRAGRGNESDQVGDLVRLPETAEGDFAREHGVDALRILGAQLFPSSAGEDDVARGDGDDADAELSQRPGAV